MKKSLLFTAALAGAMTLSAQSKINPAGRIMIDQYREVQRQSQLLNPLSVTPQPRISMVVIMEEDLSASELFDGLDVEILSDMAGVAVVSCELTEAERIAAIDGVLRVGFGDKLEAQMDFARPSASVNLVQSGFYYNGATRSYDGTGVVAGVYDTGIEANHLNFKNPDGSSRVQRFFHMTGSDGQCTTYTPSNIAGFTCDSNDDTHGTHVAGIMGGGYKGNGKYIKLTTPDGASGLSYESAPIPYYGVATNANLALSGGSLATANIVQAITKIFEYAESVGQPAVCNLSLGSTVGPHDGTDYLCWSLDRLSQKGIICVAAGNSGQQNLSITKKLGATGNNRYLRTYPESPKVPSAIVDLWTGSDKVIPAGWYIRQGTTIIPLIEVTEAGKTVSSSTSEKFNELFNGTITVTSSIDPSNKRYNINSSINNLSPKTTNTTTYIFFSAGGDGFSGEELYLYGYNIGFSNRAMTGGALQAGFTAGTPDNSINNIACANNVISVGSYNTRNTWPTLSGSALGYKESFPIGEISAFSAWGTTYQGKKLPLVCAPGAGIVSSYNRYNVNSATADQDMSASAPNGNATDYWGNLQGTSMACPFVAGTVALWLQACPTLTFAQVLETIEKTSTFETTMASSGRWGSGKINALEGVKYVLSNFSSIGSVGMDEDLRLIVDATETGIDVVLAGEARFGVTVYDLQGRAVASADGADGRAQIDGSALRPGVYVVNVAGSTANMSRKVVIR